MQPLLASDQSTTIVLSLIVMVGIAYLLAHLWSAIFKNFTFVSGAEYIILGIGLAAIGVLPEPQRYATAVVLPLAGPEFDFGLNTDIRKMLSQPSYENSNCRGRQPVHHHYRHPWKRCPFYIMSGSASYHWDSAVVIGCIAATGSHGAIDVIQKRLQTSKLEYYRPYGASSVGNVIAVTSFTVAVCFFHSDLTQLHSRPSPSTWGWITIGIGLGLGILFSAFSSGDSNENRDSSQSQASSALPLAHPTTSISLSLVYGAPRGGACKHISRPRPHSLSSKGHASLSPFCFCLCWPIWSNHNYKLVFIGSLAYFALRLIGKVIGSWLSLSGTSFEATSFEAQWLRAPWPLRWRSR